MASKTTEKKFTLEKLREKSIQLFGVSSSTFDGATVNLNGDYTIAEVQKVITKWLNTPITGGSK